MLLIYQSCGESQGIFLFSDDFFLPHARLDPVEFDLVRTLRGPSFEHTETKTGERADGSGLLCVFEELCAGVVFLFHG